jgi:serine protease AprX
MVYKAYLHIAFLFVLVASSIHADAQSLNKYWVIFRDKGPDVQSTGPLPVNSALYEFAKEYISPRSLARRAKSLQPDLLLDAADIPMYEPYIDFIARLGCQPVQRSRWLNAMSAYLTQENISVIEKLSFVLTIKPVVRFSFKKALVKSTDIRNLSDRDPSVDYGNSFEQLTIINALPLHQAGITGRNVLIGMLDSGFRWRAHEALRTRAVLAEHDFIFNDATTANQSNDAPEQDGHGTLTFSIIGGYMPGKLAGPAYDAEFLLAKTEYVPAEYRSEEDYWAAGIEWMEQYGVDIVSSSVGYNVFDDETGYSWANGDFNGRTSVVAQAAARAARLGVVVCTSMGNEGNGDGITGTLLTPADADSIISVGGIAPDGTLAYFSSTGPTNDGRIKPDVVGLGVGVYHARVPGPDTYGTSNGNSVSTPLVAGSAALLLSVRPELTPVEVRNALRMSAKHVDTVRYPESPNNFTGWGLVDAFRAAASLGPIFSNQPEVTINSGEMIISSAIISRYGIIPDSVFLTYTIEEDTREHQLTMTLDTTIIYPTSGRYATTLPHHPFGTHILFSISAVDSSDHAYQSPAPIANTRWKIYYGIPGLQPDSVDIPGAVLHQNYPNPFSSKASFPAGLIPGSYTVISFDVPEVTHVLLKIYNILGQVVETVADDRFSAGSHSVIWNASHYASGVYIYRLSTPSSSLTKKMVYIK